MAVIGWQLLAGNSLMLPIGVTGWVAKLARQTILGVCWRRHGEPIKSAD
jgi:hypothetical protein